MASEGPDQCAFASEGPPPLVLAGAFDDASCIHRVESFIIDDKHATLNDLD